MKKLAKRVLLLAALTSSLPLKAFPSGVAKTLLTSLVLFGTQMGRAGKPVHFVKSASGIDRIGYDLLVQTDANGNDRFVVTGSYEDEKTFVSTFNMTGDVESTILLDGKNVRSIAATKDGGYLLAGQRVDNDNAQIIKLDKNFDVEWTSDLEIMEVETEIRIQTSIGQFETVTVMKLPEVATYQPYAVQEYKDGTAFGVVGVKENEDGEQRLFLWKIATGGEPIALVEFDETYSAIGYDFLVRQNNRIIVTGAFGNFVQVEGTGPVALMLFSFDDIEKCPLYAKNCYIKGNAALNTNDNGIFFIEGLFATYNVIERRDGGYVVTGIWGPFSRVGRRLFIATFTDTLELGFAAKLEGAAEDSERYNSEGHAVVEDADGNFIVTGLYEDSLKGITSLLLLKVSSEGVVIWAKTYQEGKYNIGYSIGLANRDKIVVTGVMADKASSTPYLLLMQWSNDGEGCGVFESSRFRMLMLEMTSSDMSWASYLKKRKYLGRVTEDPLPSKSTLDEEPLNVTCTVTTFPDPAVRASHHSPWVCPLALISSLLVGRWG